MLPDLDMLFNSILCSTAGSKCTELPSPPASSQLNLSSVWDPDSPPSHGDTVSYQCQAGSKWNRFLGDFSRDNVSVECLSENKFRNITWPVCVDDIECPDPTSLNTEEIIFAGEPTAATVYNYQDTVR